MKYLAENMKTELISHLQNYTFALQMDSGIDMTERGASLVWNDYLVLILMKNSVCEHLTITTGAGIVYMGNNLLESHGLSLG